jgi:anti-sigma factor RsiW
MTMSCKKYQGLLVAYLDNELSGREKDELERHLAQCSECRALAQKLTRGIQVFKTLGQAEMTAELSPYLPDRIAAQVMEKRYAPHSWRARLGVAFGTLALLAGLVFGYMLRPYLARPPKSGDRLSLTAIRFQSEGMGVEIEGDHFILHSRDKKGENGIDLKF